MRCPKVVNNPLIPSSEHTIIELNAIFMQAMHLHCMSAGVCTRKTNSPIEGSNITQDWQVYHKVKN